MTAVHGDRTVYAPTSAKTKRRYRKILRFAAWHLAVTWWFELVLPRLGLKKVSERTRPKRMRRIARSFHALALELGGLMIKVGQFMSARLDVLPPEITAELEGLQDEVPAVPFPQIRSLAEAELGAPLSSVFASFDSVAIAAASLGQAHRAVLRSADAQDTGLNNVVVKVQRPGIDAIVAIDLAALRKVGGWLSHVRLVSSRVDMPALMEEFAQTSLEEIDYLLEAANAEQFSTDFADDPQVGVPEVVWERTTHKVLTLQDVAAIKITDTQALLAAGIDPVDVAPVFAEVMFRQLFTNGFFHADPHPGNIFVTPTPGGEVPWKLTFIDFGMMGHVPDTMKAGLRKLLVAAASRDGKGLVNAIEEVGILVPSADTQELERAMIALFSRFGGMGFAQLRDVDQRDLRDFGTEFSEIVRALPFQLPENFLLIIRAMSLSSGVCSSLDPTFNLWDSVEPFAAQLMRDQRGNIVQDVAKQALDAGMVLIRLPQRIDGVLSQLEDGQLRVRNTRLERAAQRQNELMQRLISVVVFAALLVTGALLRAEDVVLGNVIMLVSALPLLHALWSGRRRH